MNPNTSVAEATREPAIKKELGLVSLVGLWAFISILGGVLGGLTSSILLHETISDDGPPEEETPPPAHVRTYRAFDLCVVGDGEARLEYCMFSDEPLFRRPLQHRFVP